MKNLLIRSDGNSRIGIGHLMRCLALAQAWQNRYGKAFLLTSPGAEGTEKRFLSEKIEILHQANQPGGLQDAANTSKMAKEVDASWVIVDGYHFTSDFQKILKEAGHRLLFVDDYGHADFYWADVVLNQNMSATSALYKNRQKNTRLLLGSAYVLLRKEFFRWQGEERVIPNIAKKILVTMGGADSKNVTKKILHALNKVSVKDMEVIVLAGSNNLHLDELSSTVNDLPMNVVIQKDFSDMPGVMAWADAAISAAGSTCWELSFFGLPSLVIVTAENQVPVAKGLSDQGAAVNLGWYDGIEETAITDCLNDFLLSSKSRSELYEKSRRLVDGYGSERILSAMQVLNLKSKRVTRDDCSLLWRWVNEPDARRSAFNQKYISWEEHFKWFENKIHDPSCKQYIFSDDNAIPIGQVRFDVKENAAEIDVSVEASKRGAGYGSQIIQSAVDKLVDSSFVDVVHSYIKAGNIRSRNAFLKAGFTITGTKMLNNQEVDHLVWRGNGQ